ncbi:MAG: DinB family protein [bacterium]|nr:DinB family protein [bacterium]
MLARPAANEYHEYYGLYTKRVPDGDIMDIFERQKRETLELLSGVDEERGGFRYAEGKWSLREVVGHLNDIERVFCYRALIIARGDQTPQAGVEQDDFITASNYDQQSLSSVTEQFRVTREATISLFHTFDEEIGMRTGTASDRPFTVRSIAYIIAGHEIHHVGVLKERYL